jgi:PTH1 family peptidyl-tRNA hydrolase
MPDISVVLGLGNPGGKYAGTRHNLGFDTLDIISTRHNLRWKISDGVSASARWPIAGRHVILLKPLTFMNLSGEALNPSKVSPDSLLVVCDDIHLPLGILRIRTGGGSGGHRGLESVARILGSENFGRLRIGVGPPPPGEQWSDYVLERLGPQESASAEQMTQLAADAVEDILLQGMRAAQNRYNRKAGRDEGSGASTA